MAFNPDRKDIVKEENICTMQQKYIERETIQQAKTYDVQVCRICFVTDCNLNTMKMNKNLRLAYSTLTGLSIEDGANIPPYVCNECSSQLLHCARFRNKTLQAHLVLLGILRKHECITLDIIKTVKKSQGLVSFDMNVAQNCTDLFGVETTHIKKENIDADVQFYINNEPSLLHDVVLDDIKKENEDINSQESYEEDNASVPHIFNEGTIHSSLKEEKEFKEDFLNNEDISNNHTEYSDASMGGDLSADYLTEEKQTGCTNITDVKEVISLRTQNCPDGVIFYNKLCCDMCSYQTVSDLEMSSHLKTHTSSELNRNNNTCNSRKQNSRNEVFICHFCNKTSASKYNLQKHIKTHLKVKEYACKICRKSFVANGYLQNHLRTHSGEKPYICDLCNKSFSERGNLLRHIRIHAGEKPFSCKVCRRSFNQRHHLKRHMVKHSKIK